SPQTSRLSPEKPCALRFPCECFRATSASAQRCGSSDLCPRESAPGEGARSQWRCCRVGSPRNGRRTELVSPFRCSVRTSFYLAENQCCGGHDCDDHIIRHPHQEPHLIHRTT